MKLRQARPVDGLRWMSSGVRLVARQPWALGGLTGFMLFGLGLLLSLRYVGPVLAGVLMPALCAGWVVAGAIAETGTRPMPQVLLQALGPATRKPVLMLGLWHAVAVATMLWLADLVDPGMSEAWSNVMGSELPEAAQMSAMEAVQQGMFIRMAMLIPVSLVFWHAPVILVRSGGSVARALFGSALASLRNLGAFFVYGVAWVAADLALSALVGGALSLLGLGQWAMMLAVPAALFFTAAFYASLRATVDGCIDFEDAPPAAAA